MRATARPWLPSVAATSVIGPVGGERGAQVVERRRSGSVPNRSTSSR